MRLILAILIFSSGTVFSTHYEKTRYDRSINDDSETSIINKGSSKNELIFTDHETRFRAIKAKEENDCYLENLGDDTAANIPENNRGKQKVLYAPVEALTKLEAWRIAGGRIIDFCKGRKILLLQSTIPIPDRTIDPFFNIIPQDENDIVTRRVADVVLTPLISRAKREIALEEREKLNENVRRTRSRRQTQQPRGRFRGQTQSQYLNIGGDDQKEGKAEAEATQQSSRAIVSGSRGMGQAQSMSMGSLGCEDCPKYTIEDTPERYVQLPSAGTGYPGATASRTGGRILPETVGGADTYPTTGQSGTTMIHPGRITPGTATYPSGIPQGAVITDGGKVYTGAPNGGAIPGATIREGVTYPGGTVPGTTGTRNGVIYNHGVPGTTAGGVVYPGGVPGPTTGGGVVYLGRAPDTTSRGGAPYPGTTSGGGAVYPGTTTGGGVLYPSSAPDTISRGGTPYPGTTTGGGVVYPSGVSGPTTGGGVLYPGSAPDATSRGGAPYPGTTTGGGVVYPGSIPGHTTGSGVVYPGNVPGTTGRGGVPYPVTTTGGGVVYPGGVLGPTTGGGVVYPGSAPDDTSRGGTPYPSTTTGGGVVYPGNAPDTTSRGGVVYPGNAADTTSRGGVPYPGSTTGGGVPYPVSVPVTTTGVGVPYPGSVPGATSGSGVTYPVNIPGATSDGVVYPGTRPTGGVIYPGTIVSDGRTGIAYPEGTKTSDGNYLSGTRQIVPGQIITESKATADTKVYPSGQTPDMRGARVTYPGIVATGPLPAGIPGGTTISGAEGIINYPHSIPPSDNQLREAGYYPGKLVPGSANVEGQQNVGTIPTGVGTYPGSIIPDAPGYFVRDRTNYPGNYPVEVDGTRLYPGGTSSRTSGPSGGPHVVATGPDTGTVVSYPIDTQGKIGQGLAYPHIMQTGPADTQKIGRDQLRVPYPHDMMRYPGGNVIQQPGVESYPGSSPVVPPDYSLQGQYPGPVTWHDRQGQTVPDVTRGGAPGEIIKQGSGQYLNGQNVGQQYPGLQYSNGMGFNRGTGEPSQYYQQTDGVPSKEDDNSDSQASSSVKQTDSGTQASASAQGKHGQGTAQSQVTGTYSGSGSFSAQAGSSDVNKNVQTEVSGGKEGATSNAQGTGGYGKSQAQVQLNSDSGATSTGAQSGGWNHGTNSQVQASSRGGMADAQANGEGSTSSQAQIGFQPYLKTDEKLERHSKPFGGGGTASAQSGMYRGQSQSQLEGSFQYGITYTGAAQAGSGSGAAASRKPFNFSHTDTELFKSFKPHNPQVSRDIKGEVVNSSGVDEYNQDKGQPGLRTSSSSRKTVVTDAAKENARNKAGKQNQSAEKPQVDDTVYDYEEDYEGEDYDTSQMQTSMNSKLSKAHVVEQNNTDYQSQAIHVATGDQFNVHVNQNSNTAQPGDVIQPGESLSGYMIPPGFRGRVKSVAGDETIAHGDGKSQSQTVSLTSVKPNITHEKSPLSETRSLKTNHERLTKNHVSFQEKPHRNNFSRVRDQQTTEYSKSDSNVPIKQSYYTVTNSFAGKMDDGRSSPRKYEHRYYTKSSTCGYFTFSCNMVYGSNGRTKICKSKMPTHPDGTPMKC